MSLVEYPLHPSMVAQQLTARVETTGNRWVDIVAPAAELANQIANTEFVPPEMRGKPDIVAACILYGDAIGLHPMMALAKVDIVKGRPAPKAELARALALAAGHEVNIVESSNTRVTVEGRRGGSTHRQKVTWTMDDVKKAGITSPMYAKYPRQMLLARASAELVRAMCPDVLGGIGRFAEELDDVDQPDDPQVAPTKIAASASRKRQRAPLAPVAELEMPPLPGEESDGAQEEQHAPITDAQITKLAICFRELGITDRTDRVRFLCDAIGRNIESSKEMTKAEASHVIDRLENPATADPALDDEPF